MAIFLSTFINKVDGKGRVSLPATFRSALSPSTTMELLTPDFFQGFVAFRSYKYPALECYSYSRMEALSQSVDKLDLFSQESDDFSAAIFADAVQIPFDNDGRIILPKKLSEFSGIKDSAAFVGRGATFQIWAPEAFEKVQQQARDRIQKGQSTLSMSGPKEGV